MNKKLIPVLVGVALIAGAGYYLTTKKPADMMTKNEVMSEANEFAKAMESGKPTICTMTKGTGSMEYLIKGKMMKAEIKTTVEGKVMTSHMINDTKYLYSWSDGTPQGSKMAIPTEEETKAMADKAREYQDQYPADPKFDSDDYESYKNEGYTIDCKPSSADDSAFVAPTNIKFVDPTEMMKAIPSPDANGKYDMSKYQELQKQYGETTPPDSY
jgi:hypothetical protein